MFHFLFCEYGWWVSGCEEEELCHVSDIRDEGPLYFACVLYPDTRVCGAYDKPLRQACSFVMTQNLQTAYQKKGESFIAKMPCLTAIKWQDFIYDTKIWSFVLYNSITQYTRPQILCGVYNAFVFLSISSRFSETFLCDWTDGFCITLCKSVVYCKVWCQTLTTFIVTWSFCRLFVFRYDPSNWA